MEPHSLPSPPLEEQQHKSHAKKRSTSGAKSTKPVHRASKRSSTTTTTHAHAHLHSPISTDSQSTHSMADGRHKRVWKACERCRMKKTKVITTTCPQDRSLHSHAATQPLVWSVTHIKGSATENSHVRDARTTVLYAQQAHERRQNLSNCHEGMSSLHTALF